MTRVRLITNRAKPARERNTEPVPQRWEKKPAKLAAVDPSPKAAKKETP
jgi:hypothetical protein